MEKNAGIALGLNAATGTQECRVGENQGRRKPLLVQQTLTIVKVTKNEAEQVGALYQPCLQAAPFLMRNQHGQRVQLPGPFESLRITIDIVGDAVLAQEPPGGVAPGAQFIASQPSQSLDEGLPMCAGAARREDHFVINPGGRGIIQ